MDTSKDCLKTSDPLLPNERSALMSRIRSRDTVPELLVRSMLHRHGYRFRVCVKGLPGKPDIVFRSHRIAIFIHGCFWHRHSCKFAYTPKTRQEFWQNKFRQNIERDMECTAQLMKIGWKVLVAWECETADMESLADKLIAAIGPRNQSII